MRDSAADPSISKPRRPLRATEVKRLKAVELDLMDDRWRAIPAIENTKASRNGHGRDPARAATRPPPKAHPDISAQTLNRLFSARTISTK